MSTPTIDLIERHRSIRDYKPDPVDPALVEAIIAAAQRSSTSSNLQMGTAVVVTNADKRQRLAEISGNQQHVPVAPVFVTWCADLYRLDRACQLRGYEQVSDLVENFLLASVDVAIMMQSAALAAESLGLGMCYIGAIRNDTQAVIDLLELPALVFPVCGMTLGWPASTPMLRPRLATEAVLHWERYDTELIDRALADYDQAMIETGIYSGRQVPVPGGQDEMEEYGWTEHSARRASKALRPELRQVLVRQGFDLK